MMWACLYLVWNMYGRTSDQANRKLFRQGAILLVAAISVWLFDSNFCFVYQYVPNPQLHAFWHVLVSFLGLVVVVVLVTHKKKRFILVLKHEKLSSSSDEY